MKYTVSICEDEIKTCEKMDKLLSDIFNMLNLEVNIDVFYSGEAYIEHLRRGNRYDFSILDIKLVQMNGVDVGKYIREIQGDLRTQIIYISSYTSYAMELFDIQPLDFLIKPIDTEHLLHTIKKGLSYLGNEKDIFVYKKGKEIRNVLYSEILYFRSTGRKIEIFAMDFYDTFYSKLSDIKLNIPKYFVQVHKSYLVNINMVRWCRYEEMVLLNDMSIPISRPYRKEVREWFLERSNSEGKI